MRDRRTCGKGYENKNVVIRRGKDSPFAFLYFSVIFGAVIYLVAAAISKALLTESIAVSLFSFVL
ncbi:MAG: hypothetical protein J6Y74_00480 [Clostridia bacterium]|nr:hypothetical protein [Clostridia bacterium]